MASCTGARVPRLQRTRAGARRATPCGTPPKAAGVALHRSTALPAQPRSTRAQATRACSNDPAPTPELRARACAAQAHGLASAAQNSSVTSRSAPAAAAPLRAAARVLRRAHARAAGPPHTLLLRPRPRLCARQRPATRRCKRAPSLQLPARTAQAGNARAATPQDAPHEPQGAGGHRLDPPLARHGA